MLIFIYGIKSTQYLVQIMGVLHKVKNQSGLSSYFDILVDILRCNWYIDYRTRLLIGPFMGH